MVKAIWNGETIAESDNTELVEGNHYFPRADVHESHLVPSTTKSVCPWKGTAHYYTITAGGQQNDSAAWFYPDPKPEAERIRDRIAFWHGVKITD